MREITAMQPSEKRPDQLRVQVDGKWVANVSLRAAEGLQLAVGGVWDDALAAAVAEEGGFDKAMKQAMNRLGRRAMSRRQLDDKLRRLEHPQRLRDAVLDRLETLGYLDDRAFAEAVVRETLRAKPAGPTLLRQKLYQKGVPRAVSDVVLAEHTPAADEQTLQAAELATRRLASLSRYDRATQQRRLYGLLARRGFSPDVIRDALHQAFTEVDDLD